MLQYESPSVQWRSAISMASLAAMLHAEPSLASCQAMLSRNGSAVPVRCNVSAGYIMNCLQQPLNVATQSP